MENNSNSQPTEPRPDEENKDKWCFCHFAGDGLADYKERAAILKNAKWQPGDVITISFLNGDSEVREKVIASAMKWIDVANANLTFQFRKDTTNTNIRISFDRPGSWSYLGTTCKDITNIEEPTMNFGWLDKNSSDVDIDRVVLHEFGHAIGMIHEHISPEVTIKWDKEQVIKDLSSPPNNWSRETIDNNMFRTFEKEELELTSFDEKSIMMYPIPSKWTTNGFSVGLNSTLSQKDIELARQVYSGKNDLGLV